MESIVSILNIKYSLRILTSSYNTHNKLRLISDSAESVVRLLHRSDADACVIV